MGETHMRLSMEMEALYASEFPFLTYGQDLREMAELEKGIEVTQDTKFMVEPDLKVDKKRQSEVREYLSKNLQSRHTDKVPLKFVGKGHHGYLCYDVVSHRGKSAPVVT
jgi:hypothetical protein